MTPSKALEEAPSVFQHSDDRNRIRSRAKWQRHPGPLDSTSRMQHRPVIESEAWKPSAMEIMIFLLFRLCSLYSTRLDSGFLPPETASQLNVGDFG